MKRLYNIVAGICLVIGMLAGSTDVQAQEAQAEKPEANPVDVKEILFSHIGDTYEWHIGTWGDVHLTIPLPIISSANVASLT